MEQIVEREESIKRYLLGELTENEQAKIEIQLFTDDDYFSEILLMENEIMDDFAFGVLSDHEKEIVGRYISSTPKQQEKLIFTKALGQYISENVSIDASEIAWKDSLAEAQESRYLLTSLLDEDWRGLHLLALLRSLPQDKKTLATRLQLAGAEIIPNLIRLIECGVIEERGDKFFCTKLGLQTLARIEEASGIRISL